jgi:hypothetical protein
MAVKFYDRTQRRLTQDEDQTLAAPRVPEFDDGIKKGRAIFLAPRHGRSWIQKIILFVRTKERNPNGGNTGRRDADPAAEGILLYLCSYIKIA